MTLLIDDMRSFFVDILTRTAAAGIEVLRSIDIDHLYLDHDLGTEGLVIDINGRKVNADGYAVLLWLEANIDRCSDKITLVTSNPAGRTKMELALTAMHYEKSGDTWEKQLD